MMIRAASCDAAPASPAPRPLQVMTAMMMMMMDDDDDDDDYDDDDDDDGQFSALQSREKTGTSPQQLLLDLVPSTPASARRPRGDKIALDQDVHQMLQFYVQR